MDKVIRDGLVAVLYSPGFGAGWYTWNSDFPECVFDRDIVGAVESGDIAKAASIAEEKYGDGFYSGGARDLQIAWIKQGMQFEINEYDGAESIHQIGEHEYFTA